jgi:hypothetical protein
MLRLRVKSFLSDQVAYLIQRKGVSLRKEGLLEPSRTDLAASDTMTSHLYPKWLSTVCEETMFLLREMLIVQGFLHHRTHRRP